MAAGAMDRIRIPMIHKNDFLLPDIDRTSYSRNVAATSFLRFGS